MYKYYFSYSDFDGNEYTRLTVRNHELSDKEIEEELSSIFTDNENVKCATLDRVSK